MSRTSGPQTDRCQWCGIEIVCFVGPPSMTSITATTDGDQGRVHSWRICLDCYASLLKLIAERPYVLR